MRSAVAPTCVYTSRICEQACVSAMLPVAARLPANTSVLRDSLNDVEWAGTAAASLFEEVKRTVALMCPGLFSLQLDHLLAHVVSATPVTDSDEVVPLHSRSGTPHMSASEVVRRGLVYSLSCQDSVILEMPLLWLALAVSRAPRFPPLHPEFFRGLATFIARLPFVNRSPAVASTFEDTAAEHLALVAMAHHAVKGRLGMPVCLGHVFPGAIMTPSAEAINVQFARSFVGVERSVTRFPAHPPKDDAGLLLLRPLLDDSTVVLNEAGAAAFDAAVYLPPPPESTSAHPGPVRLLLQLQGYKATALSSELVVMEDTKSRRALASMGPGTEYLPATVGAPADVTVLLSYGRRGKTVDNAAFKAQVLAAFGDSPSVVICHEFGVREYFGVFGLPDCFVASGKSCGSRICLLVPYLRTNVCRGTAPTHQREEGNCTGSRSRCWWNWGCKSRGGVCLSDKTPGSHCVITR